MSITATSFFLLRHSGKEGLLLPLARNPSWCSCLFDTHYYANKGSHCCRSSSSFSRRGKRRIPRSIIVTLTRVNVSDPPILHNENLQSLVHVPVTCYQILGVPSGCTKDQVVRAAMELKSSEIDDGYSSSVLPCRHELLIDVRDKILFEPDFEGNTKENVPPRSSLSIPWPWLPAAMSLLQEVGEEANVMEIGRMCLQQENAKPYIHDIMLSMSLAECSIARKCFEKGAISEGFEALARAQLLLRSKKSLSKLTLLTEIEASLEELAPSCLLENLSLPRIAENVHRREGALGALLELLRQGLEGETSCCIRDWPVFLDKVMDKLLAGEIVGLLPWGSLAQVRKNHYAPEAKQQRNVIDYNCFYMAMLAHIALGFSKRSPELIETAKNMAESLERSEAVTLSFENNVCKFLLGQVNVGAVFDGQNVGTSKNQELGHGVLKKSESDLHAFLEKWLKDVALGVFVDTRDCMPSLVNFFSKVKTMPTNAWKRSDEINSQSDPSLRSSNYLSSSPAQNLITISPVDSLPSASLAEDPADVDQASSNLADATNATAVATDNSIFSKSKNMSFFKWKNNVPRKALTGAPEKGKLAGKLIFIAFLASSAFAMHKVHSRHLTTSQLSANVSEQKFHRFSTLETKSNQSSLSTTSENVMEGTGERFWKVVSGWLVPSFQKIEAEQNVWPVNDLSILMGKYDTTLFYKKKMMSSEAEALVREWQTIKAEALGPNHEMHRLSEILAEPMLSQWQALALSAKSTSCFWRFMLLQLSIVHAEISYDNIGWEIAEIEAVLEEAAELISEPQSKNPNYYSTYRIKYLLKRDNNAKWKFFGGGIQSPA